MINKEYLDWLHELTKLGYKADPYLIISAKDSKLIMGYFEDGKTPAEAFDLYKKYRTQNVK